MSQEQELKEIVVDNKATFKVKEGSFTDPISGLTQDEVNEKRIKYGYNESIQERKNLFVMFLKKFWGTTPWILEITAILSFVLQHWANGVIIVVLLILNGILGFLQEKRALNALEALKQKLQIDSRVLRDGKWQLVPAKELVPGDVVRVRIGDVVPADIKNLDGDLEVDQSALTGESELLHKVIGSDIYAGSIVKNGESLAIVTATGKSTLFGKTVNLVSISTPKLHVEAIISKVVWSLLGMVITMLIVATLISTLVQKQNILNILPLILILFCSAVPIALPAMFTVTMSLGSMQLVKKGETCSARDVTDSIGVLITRLSVTEDAASMSVLCADKTGTITKNQLTVVDKFAVAPFTSNDVFRIAALCSKEENADAIDTAILNSAKVEIAWDTESKGFTQKAFTPFSPKLRRTEAVIQEKDNEFNVMKGAFQSILDLCLQNEIKSDELKGIVDQFACKGYRSIAVAKKNHDEELFHFIGILALSDLPRTDSKDAIEQLKKLGIQVKMLTGDALPIAREVATQVELGKDIISLTELKRKQENGTNDVLSSIVSQTDGFAEIFPEDKHAIVKALQDKGFIVGMTGDGVNDAPALRQAEVGIAVSNATDVAKGAASAVLTIEGLSAIPDLVKVGRMIHQRIVTWIVNKIMKTFITVVFIVVAYLIEGIFIADQFDILMLLFLVDFVTIALATDSAKWSKEPEKWDVLKLVRVSVALGLVAVGECFGLLYIGMDSLGLRGDLPSIHTYVFEILFFMGLVTILNVRERSWFWKSTPSKWLLSALAVDSIIVILVCTFGIPPVGFHAIPIWKTAIVIGVTLGSGIVNDVIKVIFSNTRYESLFLYCK